MNNDQPKRFRGNVSMQIDFKGAFTSLSFEINDPSDKEELKLVGDGLKAEGLDGLYQLAAQLVGDQLVEAEKIRNKVLGDAPASSSHSGSNGNSASNAQKTLALKLLNESDSKPNLSWRREKMAEFMMEAGLPKFPDPEKDAVAEGIDELTKAQATELLGMLLPSKN